MGLEQKDFSLDGDSYVITLFPADQGLKVLTKLIKLVGEPIMEMSKANQDKEKVYEYLTSAIRLLSARMDDENVVSLCRQLSSCVIKEGDGSMSLDKKFNTHFSGRIGHLFKLMVEVVNFNFADFLDVLALHQNAGSATVLK